MNGIGLSELSLAIIKSDIEQGARRELVRMLALAEEQLRIAKRDAWAEGRASVFDEAEDVVGWVERDNPYGGAS
jgi:F0F1-type ATP synthase membrane subunit b/b'